MFEEDYEPIYYDVNPETYMIDYDEVEKLGELTQNEKGKQIQENLDGELMFAYIQKLEKEIEELKIINNMQKYRIEVIDERELIPKQKIKDKIEELEKIHKNQDWTQKQGFYYDCLQELLKEE